MPEERHRYSIDHVATTKYFRNVIQNFKAHPGPTKKDYVNNPSVDKGLFTWKCYQINNRLKI